MASEYAVNKVMTSEEVLRTYLDPAMILEAALTKLRADYAATVGRGPQFIELRVYGTVEDGT